MMDDRRAMISELRTEGRKRARAAGFRAAVPWCVLGHVAQHALLTQEQVDEIIKDERRIRDRQR